MFSHSYNQHSYSKHNQSNKHSQYNPNKVLILNIKELVFLPYYNYDNLLIRQRAKNTYYDKIIQ
jgi:hypothetical protein